MALVVSCDSVSAFVIEKADDCVKKGNWNIPELQEQKKNVNKSKTWMDTEYAKNPKVFSSTVNLFRLDKYKNRIQQITNAQKVTNAWIKALELLNHYKCIPQEAENFTYMGIGEFPGSFILAVNYAVSFARIKNFKWIGASLLDINEETKSPLEDTYGLYENYPNNWLMSPNNNGDVTSIPNLLDCHVRYPNNVDVITGDIGMNFEGNYGEEESVQAHANVGQVASALMMLKKGGISMTKMYSYFEPLTVSLLALTTRVFDRVEMCKPMFSRPGNTETYLICIGYKGYDFSEKYINVIMDKLSDWNMEPLVSLECLNDKFVESIIMSSKAFSDITIETLNAENVEYHRLKQKSRKEIQDTNCFNAKNKEKLELWVKCNNPMPMANNKKLNVKGW